MVQGLEEFVDDEGRKRRIFRRTKQLRKLASTGLSHELDDMQQGD